MSGAGDTPTWADPERRVNIAHHLPARAARTPFKQAVVFPEGRDARGRVTYAHLTYRQLDEETSRLARGLREYGVVPGERVLVMVTPSLEFIALAFALFRMGAVPVLIDPGMGRTSLLECIARVEPRTLVGIPRAQLAMTLFPGSFRSVERRVTVGGRRWLWGGATLDEVRARDASPYPLHDTHARDLAALLFTTGSTGPPKGVMYTHGIFDAQVHMIREEYGLCPEDVDLPGFPLFALFSTAWGMTCVIPDMDPTRPAQVDPVRIVEAVRNFGVTTSFGSPAIWRRVGRHCREHGIRLPSVKRVLMAGAPIPGDVLGQFPEVLPEGETYTPYGATECLPTASISGSEILGETWDMTRRGRGNCVGRALSGNTIRVMEITEGPLERWDPACELPAGEVGEIVVRGPVVTPGYYGQEEATRSAKLDDEGRLCHRMGDLGYLDEQGRLWFCGRKAHRVETPGRRYYSVCCEAIFNEHPRIFRAALVGVRGRPAMVVEPEPGEWPETPADRQALTRELHELAASHEHTADIAPVLFHRSFPVDIRHNAKIFREKLAVWAAGEVREDAPGANRDPDREVVPAGGEDAS